MVVSHNEAADLPRCLASLAFCAERIVVDLESTDDTAETARRLGAQVLKLPWVPLVEWARPAAVAVAAHDWVLLVDPDEEVSPGLPRDIAEVLERDDGAVGVVDLPWRNFWKGRPLKGTFWGGTDQMKGVLVHRRRVDLPDHVHSERRLHAGCRAVAIPPRAGNYLNHYWVESLGAFLEKHRRYIRLEGEARYGRGERFSWPRALARLPLHFHHSFVGRRGYRDGVLGLFLSLFWAAYNFAAGLSLRSYQRGLRRSAAGAGSTIA